MSLESNVSDTELYDLIYYLLQLEIRGIRFTHITSPKNHNTLIGVSSCVTIYELLPVSKLPHPGPSRHACEILNLTVSLAMPFIVISTMYLDYPHHTALLCPHLQDAFTSMVTVCESAVIDMPLNMQLLV